MSGETRSQEHRDEIELGPPEEQVRLLGPHDRFLKRVRDAFGAALTARKGTLRVSGSKAAVRGVRETIGALQRRLDATGQPLTEEEVDQVIAQVRGREPIPEPTAIPLLDAGRTVAPRSAGQERLIDAIRSHDITICLGPAGTGKTYLAAAMALHALGKGEVRKVIMARPAVEAGEKLGFLPGDLQEKVNPYLHPLYDAMEDLLDLGKAKRLLERGLIEIAPVAFMRGRTLDRAFVILDEAQNCTVKQMMMFLTRIGPRAKAVVNGDVTQIDLPEGETSGLVDAVETLEGVPGIAIVRMEEPDIVRHPLVRRIVNAYQKRAEAKERQ